MDYYERVAEVVNSMIKTMTRDGFSNADHFNALIEALGKNLARAAVLVNDVGVMEEVLNNTFQAIWCEAHQIRKVVESAAAGEDKSFQDFMSRVVREPGHG